MKTTHTAAAIIVDYACERRCQVEIDLSEVHARTTVNKVVEMARHAHDSAHAAEPHRHYRISDAVLVRAEAVTG